MSLYPSIMILGNQEILFVGHFKKRQTPVRCGPVHGSLIPCKKTSILFLYSIHVVAATSTQNINNNNYDTGNLIEIYTVMSSPLIPSPLILSPLIPSPLILSPLIPSPLILYYPISSYPIPSPFILSHLLSSHLLLSYPILELITHLLGGQGQGQGERQAHRAEVGICDVLQCGVCDVWCGVMYYTAS
jgi:hypothetical protein